MIESDGEVAVRVDRIAASAGVTKPVLYSHFGDREGLIVAAQAERFRRSLRMGMSDVAAAVQQCRSADDFFAIFSAWVRTFGEPDGVIRRRMRVEVLGSAVSRPALQRSVQQAHDDHMDELAAIIQVAQDNGWVSTQFTAKTYAAWWTGLVLSRHIVDVEPHVCDVAQWDAMTELVLRFVVQPTTANA